MRCPKCGFELQDGAVECGKCGVIIAKAMRPSPHRPASAAPPAPLPSANEPEATASAPGPATAALIGLALLALIGAAWWLNFPSASALPDGAYINQKHRFAFAPPAEWLQLTRENAKQVFEQHQDRFPPEIRSMVANPGFEVSYTRLAAEPSEFSPSLNVVVMELKEDLPPLTESDREKAARTIFGELARMLNTYQPGSSSLVDVDGIRSLQLTGTASLDVVLEPSQPIMSEKGAFGLSHVTGHTPEVRKTFELRSVQLFVPGKKRAYVISYTAEASAFGESAATFDLVTASFRVMDRPPRFGPVLRGALNGGLVGGGLYLFVQFIGKLVLVLGGRRA
jgi:hypothetical protein